MEYRDLWKALRDNPGANVSELIVTRLAAGEFQSEAIEGKTLPPFTRVELAEKPGIGSHIRIEVWLPEPEHWNGRFVGTGNGGIAGTIRHDRLADYLMQGYACANTDLGTSGGKLCGCDNPDVWADFGWRATHLMTVDAKTVIRTFYGETPKYSYFVGRSTGGQQAFSEAQRFPEDYDGICAGVPGFYRTALHVYFCWNYCRLHTKDNAPIFTEAELREISSLAPAYFSEKGGAEPGDDFVSYPWHGADTPRQYVTWLRQRLPWMTAQQENALLAVYSGPSDPRTGKKIYCGMPIGSELQEGGMVMFSGDHCRNFYPFFWAFGSRMQAEDFDFSAGVQAMQRLLSEDMDAVAPDLSAFAARNGKLLGYSGSADPWVPFSMSLTYCEKAAEAAGGTEALLHYFRYYLIPGRAHSGGPGADVLYLDKNRQGHAFHALVRWVEQGIAPEKLLAAGRTNSIEREVFPYGSSHFPFRDHA